MRFSLPLLGLTTQVSFQRQQPNTMSIRPDFALKEGSDVFAPKDLIELARPGTGVANTAGDLALIPVSKYSFEQKKNQMSIFITPLESTVQPLEIPLAKGGDAFWLDSRTVAHVVEGGEDKDKILELYALSLRFSTEGSSAGILETLDAPALIGTFPVTTASNFRFVPASSRLVFSAYIYPDGNLSSVKAQDEAWENRGNSALVYDTGYERHWDTWVGPKYPSLFSVRLHRSPDQKWAFGNEFVNTLQGTGHRSPVEPFGGTDNFDVSRTNIVYTAKDPSLPEAWHTKQNIYIVGIDGYSKPKELTSGTQGATNNPVFNSQGNKVAWLEMDEDGYEADRAKIVIYDLEKNVRFRLTQKWDRSPESLAFSKRGDVIYFTAGDKARVKIFVLSVPETPDHSSIDPSLPARYTSPVALTQEHAVSAIEPLYNGRLLFSKSSFSSPNDVFIIRGLEELEDQLHQTQVTSFNGEIEQITRFTESALKAKDLDKGEDFWFTGAHNKTVHGWTLKPKGWKKGEAKKWPIVLLIHGGPQGAWEDQWSTRWNPNIFTQQGYFTVAINPTGSTTFGQEFTDAIAEDWGGKPFVDLVAGWKFILDKYPEVDPDRAVAAGASWGGYAINWIQGHPEYGFNFKALVCHDGVFDSNYNGYSTDELYFFNHEWGGRPWENKSKALSEKYSPANYVHKWSTPQLLIHGSKDFRLPETEGIGAFHALQQQGIPTRLIIFPDENHWVLDHGNSLKWHYEVFRWFDQFVGKA